MEEQTIDNPVTHMTEETFNAIRDLMPGETVEQRTEGMLAFCVMFLAGFINNVPAAMQVEARNDVVAAIDTVAADMKERMGSAEVVAEVG